MKTKFSLLFGNPRTFAKLSAAWKKSPKGSEAEKNMLERIGCSYKTAYRYLGPKTGMTQNRQNTAACKRAQVTKEQEIERLRAPWKIKEKERKEMEASSARLYEGEMFEEGAPVRAVGL